jgi:hypothetical protein
LLQKSVLSKRLDNFMISESVIDEDDVVKFGDLELELHFELIRIFNLHTELVDETSSLFLREISDLLSLFLSQITWNGLV